MVVDSDDDDELGRTTLTPLGSQDFEEAAPAQLQLAVIGNKSFAIQQLPYGKPLTIGRSSRCDITIDDESISRTHAILTVGPTLLIEDVGSANGTRVHGNQISPGCATPIAVGEAVGIGKVTIILQPRSVRPRRVWSSEDFSNRIDEECARSERSRSAFALVRIQAGPQISADLVENALDLTLRESDIIGTYGSHEYRVLLVDTPVIRAEDAVRRIESKLLERAIECRTAMACYPRDGVRSAELLAKLHPAERVASAFDGSDIVLVDEQMRGLHRLIEQVAGSRIAVLLLGETGVGKEVFARAVHRASPRAGGPFVEINCAALTETLLESELFGHEKGAFTNASASKLGLIEAADGGTLLLDEIGDMPLTTQVKLLRVIENSQLRRVGALKSRPIDVRFVAATNSDLEARVARGEFRSDLFFRLNGVTLVIPPLRERLSDVEPLAETFIRGASSSGIRPHLTPEALELLKGYSWPGNVRELKHMLERAVLLCGGGPIRPDHFPLDRMRHAKPPAAIPNIANQEAPIRAALPRGSAEEQEWIVRALERAGGNQTLAASALGISRRTLVSRLNEYTHVHRPRKPKKT